MKFHNNKDKIHFVDDEDEIVIWKLNKWIVCEFNYDNKFIDE